MNFAKIVIMPITPNMSSTEKYFEVMRFWGKSYSFTNLKIDGPDGTINEKIKDMQAKEFEEVAEIRLFIQKEHYRHKLMREKEQEKRCLKEESKKAVIVRKISDDVEDEFRDFKISDFIPLTFSEEELADIIIDNKMDDIEENETKKDRCCAWVLNHCK